MGLLIQTRSASLGVYVDLTCPSLFQHKLQTVVESVLSECHARLEEVVSGQLTYFCWTTNHAQELMQRIQQITAPHFQCYQEALEAERRELERNPASASTWTLGYGIEWFSTLQDKGAKEALLSKVLPYCPALVTRLAELGIAGEKKAQLEKQVMTLLSRDLSLFFACYQMFECDLTQLARLTQQEIPYKERRALLMEFVWRDLADLVRAEELFKVSREDCDEECSILFKRLLQNPSRLCDNWGLSLYLMRQDGHAEECSQLMLGCARLFAKRIPSQQGIPPLFFVMNGTKGVGALMTPRAREELSRLWVEYLVCYPSLLFPAADDRVLALLNCQVTAMARIHTKKGEDQDRILRSAIKQNLPIFPKYAREMGELMGRTSPGEGSPLLLYWASRDPVGMMLYRKLFATVPLPEGVEEKWNKAVQCIPNLIIRRAKKEGLALGPFLQEERALFHSWTSRDPVGVMLHTKLFATVPLPAGVEEAWIAQLQKSPDLIVKRAQEEGIPLYECAVLLYPYDPGYVTRHLEEWGLELDV